MKVDAELIKRVAANARLNLTDKEVNEFIPQFKEILDYFSELDKINTKDVKPSFQPVLLRNALREDKPGHCLTQEEALKNAHHKKEGYFKGPRAV